MTAEHSRISEEGKKLGALMARAYERGREILAAHGLTGINQPALRDEMCASCACRVGAVPNGCIQTQMDLMKSVIEGKPFYCHAPMDGRMCAGWVAARAAFVSKGPMPKDLLEAAAQWEYSPADPIPEPKP